MDYEHVTSGWERIVKGEPQSIEQIEAFEEERGLRLPDGVRWLEQQPFVFARHFGQLVKQSLDGPEEPSVGPLAISERVTVPAQPWWCKYVEPPEGAEDGEQHFFAELVFFGELPPVYGEWMKGFLVVCTDDFCNAYMLDYHFDRESPPVVYADWSEGSALVGTATVDLVADTYDDFLRLPGMTGDHEIEFVPQRPARLDEWNAWMTERTAEAARHETNPAFLR